MKIHRPILVACQQALYAIFVEGAHAGVVIEKNLKNQKKWGARDRRLFSETVYDVVRWWRRLFALAELPFRAEGCDAAVIEKVLQTYFLWKDQPSDFQGMIEKLPFADRESIPDELDQWGREQLGDQWEPLICKLNEPAKQYLRVNTLKSTREELQKKLAIENIQTHVVAGVPTGLALQERKNVFITQAFKAGGFEMQDSGSQLIAPFLQLGPGLRVVDACAGAGGKSLHAAALMKNKGQVISLDIHDWKLKELQLRARRAGVSIIETRCIDSTKVIKRLHDSADRLLLDVPCSGFGVIRRHPDTKWKFSVRELEQTLATQAEILEKYSRIVKVDGLVVYATCSVAPAENEHQVRQFLKKSEGAFELEEELKLSPLDIDSDGFYAARLRRVR